MKNSILHLLISCTSAEMQPHDDAAFELHKWHSNIAELESTEFEYYDPLGKVSALTPWGKHLYCDTRISGDNNFLQMGQMGIKEGRFTGMLCVFGQFFLLVGKMAAAKLLSCHFWPIFSGKNFGSVNHLKNTFWILKYLVMKIAQLFHRHILHRSKGLLLWI